jgi:transposase InsO family protein
MAARALLVVVVVNPPPLTPSPPFPPPPRRLKSWDNACSETLFGSLKVKRLYGQRFKTRREAKDETIAWLLCYNRTRLHSTLAYISPVQFEQNWLANQPKQANS